MQGNLVTMKTINIQTLTNEPSYTAELWFKIAEELPAWHMENLKNSFLINYNETKNQKMKKVFFVGIHNKPGMGPLDSRTKSGKVIDKMISNLPDFECVKTNFYDSTELPAIADHQDRNNWQKRVGCKPGDLVVLLGSEVKLRWGNQSFDGIVVTIDHPAKVKTTEEKWEYFTDTIKTIGNAKFKK